MTMLRLAAPLLFLVIAGTAAEARPVWRTYAPVIPAAAFAYVGPGNAVWRLWRSPAALSPRPARLTSPAPLPQTAASDPLPVVAQTTPSPAPPPEAANEGVGKDVEPPVATPAATAPPLTISPAVADTPQSGGWSHSAQVWTSASIVALLALAVFLYSRGRRFSRG